VCLVKNLPLRALVSKNDDPVNPSSSSFSTTPTPSPHRESNYPRGKRPFPMRLWLGSSPEMHPAFPTCEGILTHMSLAEPNRDALLGGKPIKHLFPMKEPTQSNRNHQKDT